MEKAGYIKGTPSWLAHMSTGRYLEVPPCASLYSSGFLFLSSLFLFLLQQTLYSN